MKKYLSALALLALVTAGAAHAQTTTPMANPSANGSGQSATEAKANDTGAVKVMKHHHHKKGVKKTDSSTGGESTSTEGTVTK